MTPAPPTVSHDVLDLFSEPVRRWFVARVGTPTEIQRLAWPRIAAGEHLLASAPTGSGKTLAAFLLAIDRLLVGAWPCGATRVLYVSPLKALGNDIRRNLERPLAELLAATSDDGAPGRTLRAAVRTGDTPPDQRRRMLRQPPEILVTTPESLNLLLTSRSGRELLAPVRTVILDEVHAVIGGKRGVHLITAVERLTRLAGEVQRIALSATVRPMETVAEWVGGWLPDDGADGDSGRRRTVVQVASTEAKSYHLEVTLPSLATDTAERGDAVWQALAAELCRTLARNRSTLVFANSRRTVEKVARFVNEAAGGLLAYSHHGALSRELRSMVEERFKAGALKAVVATSSLELGIDVGAVDQVALVQPPPSVASTVQRLGRAGHAVGQTSRGTFLALHPRALLDAAVLVPAVLAGDIEPVRPVVNPLDVLAQVVLSMTVEETWQVDDLYRSIRCASPYHTLPRRHFDLVLDLLAGRYATTRLRTLRPLVNVDRLAGTVRARAGAERLLYLAGGTIPDRGYFKLRVAGSGEPLGELDEEFVWERSVGDTFTLGVQLWKVEGITHNDVLVSPAAGRAAMAPFWRAEELDRSHFLSERLGRFLERASERLADPEWLAELERDHRLSAAAAAELRRLLLDQVAATGVLPHRHRVVVEHTLAPGGDTAQRQTVVHTFWGGRVNRPLGLALCAAFEERFGERPQVLHGDDCLVVSHRADLELDDPLALVTSAEVDRLLRRTLEGSGFFGARFREAAGCALALPRSGAGRRTPLWLHRQRAKELLQAVARWDDFPLVLEAWRTAIHDQLELEPLRRLLDEVAEGRVEVVHVHTERPSPFTRQVLWRQTNELMYADDRPGPGAGPRLRDDLLAEVVRSSHLRPRIDPALVETLRGKLQRIVEGYAPAPGDELVDWIGERIALTGREWSELLGAVVRDHEIAADEVLADLAGRVVWLGLPGPRSPLLTAVEQAPRLLAALGLDPGQAAARDLHGGPPPASFVNALERLAPSPDDPTASLETVLGEWLRAYGPLPLQQGSRRFGLAPATLRTAVDALLENDEVVVDLVTDGAVELEICDTLNLERLLRMGRAAARPGLAARPLEELPLLLAVQQGLGIREAAPADLQAALEPLFGWPAPADLWETELLPARVDPYLPGWLDALLVDTDLRWLGCGKRRLLFVLEADRDLVTADPTAADPGGADEALFPQAFGRFPFADLVAAHGGDSGRLAERLWRAAWAGRATADTFAPVRRAAAAGFRPEAAEGGSAAPSSARPRRGRFERWRASRPFAGSWFALAPSSPPGDALELDQLCRDRVRLLLERHGVLFRELLEREPEAFAWRKLFRTLRLMELAGEGVAGRFFESVPGLQFASHEAVRRLAAGLPEDRVWWLNAVDPASPCGLGLELWPDLLPRRVPGNHLVLHGRRLVVVSERRGAVLTVLVPPEHPRLVEYLRPLEVLVSRSVEPLSHLVVETVNGEPAPSSPYRPTLASRFHVTRAGSSLRLDRAY